MPEITNEFYLQFESIARCVLAAFCGALIGFERKNRLKEAGLRTHLIVALGSALMMVVSKYGFFDLLRYANELGVEVKLDPSRLASNIITGIGFLGAGTIFVRKQVINGLTTAAGLWATAGIGMAIGAGMYIVGISITVIQFLAQIVLHKNLRILRHPTTADTIVITMENGPDAVKKLNSIFEELDIEVRSLKFENISYETLEVECFVKLPNKYSLAQAAADLKAHEFIRTLQI